MKTRVPHSLSKVFHSNTLLERVQTENCLTWWLSGHQVQGQPSLSPNSIALTVPQNICPALLEWESLYSYAKTGNLPDPNPQTSLYSPE